MVRGGAVPGSCLPVATRERVVADYLTSLRAQGSPLVAEPGIMAELVSQVNAVLDDVDLHVAGLCAELSPPTPPLDLRPAVEAPAPAASPDGDTDGALSLTIGAERADAGVAPAQSLAAASLIFASTFPPVAEHLTDLGLDRPTLTAGLVVEAAITSRMSAAATTYVDYLLVKVHRSHRDERRRLARELHDIAAPAVVLGLQNLDLFRVHRDAGRPEAEAKLDLARSSLLEALQVIRALSAQSREAVGRGGLRHAISRYAATVPDVEVTVASGGPIDTIPAAYCEELFLIVREAIRNAVTHGSPCTVAVDLQVGDDHVTVTVVDDGCGFDTGAVVDDGGHLGLYSMRERAELLGGRLALTSSPDGTVVRATVDLPERRAHGIASTLADQR